MGWLSDSADTLTSQTSCLVAGCQILKEMGDMLGSCEQRSRLDRLDVLGKRCTTVKTRYNSALGRQRFLVLLNTIFWDF